MKTKKNPAMIINHLRSGDRRVCYWTENKKQKHMHYSRWLWEKNYGKIPKGWCIHHSDGNTLNDCLDNYKLMTRGDHSRITVRNFQDKIKLFKKWCKFLSEHNHLDKKTIQKRWNNLNGNTDLDKFSLAFLDFTQDEITKSLKVSLSLISRIMSGDRKITKQMKSKILDYLSNPKKIIYFCKDCGHEFNKTGNKVFCDECRTKRDKASNKKSRERHRLQNNI